MTQCINTTVIYSAYKRDPRGDLIEVGDPGANFFIERKHFLREADRREQYYIDSLSSVYLLEELCTVDEVNI